MLVLVERVEACLTKAKTPGVSEKRVNKKKHYTLRAPPTKKLSTFIRQRGLGCCMARGEGSARSLFVIAILSYDILLCPEEEENDVMDFS